MRSCLSEPELRAWIQGSLGPADHQAAGEHLEACPACRQRLADLRRVEAETIMQIDSGASGAMSSEVLALAAPQESPTLTRAGTTSADVHVPGYARLQQIGRGGQGVVYSAWQVATKRRVALKLLAGHRRPSEAQRARFRREVEALAALRHPAIVTVYESGEVDDKLYYSMEYVRGLPATEYVREHKLEPRAVLALFADIAEAVGSAHERGIVHRDLKPSNILIDEAGRPHVLDFGLAKAAGIAPPSWDVTMTGEFVGTLAYAAPEQGRGQSIDARADVYALGVVLYEALCTRRPFEPTGDLPFDIERLFSSTTIPPSQTGAGVDRDVDTILLCALNKDPARRYANCSRLAEDLRRYLEGRPVQARRDHFLYVLRKNATRLAARHPAVSMVLVVLLSVMAGTIVLLSGLLPRASDEWFETKASQWAAPPAGQGWSDDLVFLVIDDATYDALPALASTLGLPEVRTDDLHSWRLLHARAMDELAAAPPRVLAYDLVFSTPRAEFDESFAASARKLRTAGCSIILGMFGVDRSGDPMVSPQLREAVDGCGWLWSAGPPGTARAVTMTIDAQPFPLSPGLSIFVFAGLKRPGYQPKPYWSWDQMRLEVAYQRDGREEAAGPRWLPEVELLPISYQEPSAPESSGLAQTPAVRTACLWVTVSDRATLDRQTVSLVEFFRMTLEARTARFGGRAVLVGDVRAASRPRPDRVVVSTKAGDREEFGVYVHGAAVNTLLQGSFLARAGMVVEWMGMTLCALAGVGAAFVLPVRRRIARKVLLATAAVVLGLAIVFGLALARRQILSASTAVIVTLLAAGAGSWVVATRGRDRVRKTSVLS